METAEETAEESSSESEEKAETAGREDVAVSKEDKASEKPKEVS